MKALPARPRVSPGVRAVFTAYCARYVRQHFHAIRVLAGGLPPQDSTRPLVIYLNHAAWWDPLVCLLVARRFFPSRTSFAPIEAAMLERYGFFKYLGFFGIEPGTAGGARTLLRTAHALLDSADHALWLTPQGRFMDVRERPLRLEEGLGALAVREPHAEFIPLAIEYAFWTDSRPEILLSFGEPIVPGTVSPAAAADWTATFSDALESTQDELAARSCRRDPSEWRLLDRGRSGVGGVYDAWRWIKARLGGKNFTVEHPPEAVP